ncbi:hypothetical protein HY989_01140 [Candidatus Micrarchaeota archaeon]|nr:hypothetical protein [Candidatus Micrarchaeota archaeon]
MGEHEFETPKAKYKVDFENHTKKTRVPQGIDSLIFELDTKFLNESGINRTLNEGKPPFRLTTKTRETLNDAKKRNLDIWLPDVSPVNSTKEMIQAMSVLGKIFGLIPFSLYKIISYTLLPHDGKIIKRKPLLSLDGKFERTFPSLLIGGRSAIWALKAENYIADYYHKKNGKKPVLGAVMGAGHADFVDYVKDLSLAKKYVIKNRKKIVRNFANADGAFRLFFDKSSNKWKVEHHEIPIISR